MKALENFTLCCILLFTLNGFGQKPKSPLYNCKLELVNKEKFKNILYDVDSTSLYLFEGKQMDSSQLVRFNLTDIKVLKIRKKGGPGGVLLGAGIGAVVGLIAATAEGEDDSAWFNFAKENLGTFPTMLITTPIGAGIGAIIGSSGGMVFKNNGDPKSSKELALNLQEYTYKKR